MRKILLMGVASLALIAIPAQSQSIFSGASQSSDHNILSMDSSRGVVTMAPLLERVTPAVVSIRTEASETPQASRPEMDMLEEFFGRRFQRPERGGGGGSVGSGVIVDASKGYILTNHHVIAGADTIIVTLSDKRELQADLVGGDDKTDIAVLKVEGRNLREIKLAKDSSTKVGDYVVAIGNPFGLGHTVTSGIVSALGRELQRGDRYQDFIQTDASINPGNSGGALVNSKGELIGINSAILSRSGGNNGIGFAVPTKMARSVMNQLISYGEVKRGRIGISIRDITPDFKEAYDLASMEGAFVNDVTDGSPAEKAGLKSGDIVVGFNGEDILDASDIRNAVGMVEPGTRTDLTYLRDGKRRTTRILIEAFDDDDNDLDAVETDDVSKMESFSGAKITNIPSDMKTRGGDDGVYVESVRRASKAARAGITKGDIIRKVGKVSITDLEDFEDAISKKSGPIAVMVERDGKTLFLAVR